MKIVVAHNYYGDYAVGGESTVFEQEVRTLRATGHDVETLVHANVELERAGWTTRLSAALHFKSSERVYRETAELLKRTRAEILHVHNYKYVLTPAVFQAARDLGVRTVLTLHNYRLIAPCGQLRRGTRVCERCVGTCALHALWTPGCASSLRNRALQNAYFWSTRDKVVSIVDAFIALSEFGKALFCRAGLPEDRVYVKHNFTDEPTCQSVHVAENFREEPFAVFVGRIAEEKGIELLIDAWRDVPFNLLVVGDGPLLPRVRTLAPSNVDFLGQRGREETLRIMRRARTLLFPSLWYEGEPLAIVEASALGVPIIASRLGARATEIATFHAGELFDVGDRRALIESAQRILTDKRYRDELAAGARKMYETLNEPSTNIARLLEIYRETLRRDPNHTGAQKCQF